MCLSVSIIGTYTEGKRTSILILFHLVGLVFLISISLYLSLTLSVCLLYVTDIFIGKYTEGRRTYYPHPILSYGFYSFVSIFYPVCLSSLCHTHILSLIRIQREEEFITPILFYLMDLIPLSLYHFIYLVPCLSVCLSVRLSVTHINSLVRLQGEEEHSHHVGLVFLVSISLYLSLTLSVCLSVHCCTQTLLLVHIQREEKLPTPILSHHVGVVPYF